MQQQQAPQDDLMELSSALEDVRIALPNLAEQTTRPTDLLAEPADPIPFPQPRYHYGKRADVLCYNPDTQQHEVMKNCLFRDYSRTTVAAAACGDDADCRITEAYYRVPYKSNIKTIMGHVEICMVLERCLRKTKDEVDTDSDSDESVVDDDDDVVFQWTNRRVALKVNYLDRMEKLRNRHAEDPLKEIAAMQLIGDTHPNVLGCKQVLFDGKNLNVVMKFLDAGDLFQLLQDSQGALLQTQPHSGLPEGQARYWFRQIVKGMKHLHSVGICHRDLSPENVMIDREAGALIIDMGMCLRVPYSLGPGKPTVSIQDVPPNVPARRCWFKPQGACGKLPYMSPEIYKNRTPFDGATADVWTAGTILFCMLSGNRSYQRPHSSDPQFYWMTRGLQQLLADWQVNLSPAGFHLLQNMLQVDPRLRLSLEEVDQHPWFDQPDDPPMTLGA